jgi:transcriptional adapter 3
VGLRPAVGRAAEALRPRQRAELRVLSRVAGQEVARRLLRPQREVMGQLQAQQLQAQEPQVQNFQIKDPQARPEHFSRLLCNLTKIIFSTDSAAVAAQPAAPEPVPDAQPQERRISYDTNASDTEKPRPEPALPAFQTFGPDPSVFDDPTIYHIRDWTPEDDEDEIKDILGVSDYPQSDLHELTCGTPPDRNLENAKPQNQVTYNQFSTYLEAFTRPLTEEDLAFLMERVGIMSHAVSFQQANQDQGDRTGPFAVPRRGPRHYKEIWAEEDAGLFGDPPLNIEEPVSTIEASGSLEDMTDELAETSNISLGPMTSRLISAIRPIHRPEVLADVQNAETSLDADGDVKMEQNATNEGSMMKPATYFPESSLPGFKTDFPKLSSEIEERLKATLKHIGFLDPDAEPDYEGHHDDEVAARLRYLQGELQRVSIINGARKARIRELVEYYYAQQEWLTIADDLDSQLNQAYLKRHRNMGKGKAKPKRPGQVVAAGAASGVKSLGDSTRAIMQRRNDWREMIGPVVDFGESRLPQESVFSDEVMKDLMQKEKAEWEPGPGRV